LIEKDGLDDQEIKRILTFKYVAVVGASRDPSKPSHLVPKYLLEHGYDIVPVNPTATEILDRKCYPSLSDISGQLDIVDIFRPSEAVLPVVRDAIARNVRTVWMQEGIYNKEAADEARKLGIKVVWNRCMMKEHRRLFGQKP
jgi:predicted CoA-binding protein